MRPKAPIKNLEDIDLVSMFTIINGWQIQRTGTKYIYPQSTVIRIYDCRTGQHSYTQQEVLAAWSLQSGLPVTEPPAFKPLKRKVSIRRINLHSIFTIINGHQIQRTETQYTYPTTCRVIAPCNGYGRHIHYTQREILATWSRQTKECYLSVAKSHHAKSRQRKVCHVLATKTRCAQTRQTKEFYQSLSPSIATRLSSFRLRG